LWFERNRAEDTAKKLTVCNNFCDRELLIKCHSTQTNRLAESTENWCVYGLISFEESLSGLEE